MNVFEKKTETDLMKLLLEKREELRVLRFGTTGTKARDVRKARNTKREVAQILTELSLRRRNT